MFRNIMGIITFQAVGEDGSAFINTLKNSEVPCFHLRVSKSAVTGEIYRKHYGKVLSMGEKHRMQICILSCSGVRFRVIRYKKRMGILFGCLLSLFLVIYFSNIAVKIEISGNKTVTTAQLQETLKQCGIYPGAWIPSMDFDTAERKIQTSKPTISFAGIRSRGGRVVVEIKEGNSHETVIAKHIPCNIVANRDCQLVSAEVYGGSLIPAIGDGLKKGDLIVSGTYTDAHGESTTTHALARLTGRYLEKQFFSQNFEEYQTILTGEEAHKRSFYFFNLRLPFYFSTPELTQREANYSEHQTSFSLFGMNLPVGIIRQHWYYKTSQAVVFTKEEAEEQVMQKMEDYEATFLADATILSKDIQKQITEKSINLTVSYHLEGEIGQNVEIVLND